jgi:phage terminase small subunit
MPGSAKPTNLLRLEGRGHRTKAELEYRERGEKALSVGGAINESAQVKADKIAHAEFLRLKRLYSKIEFVDALDQQIINQYCSEVSNIYKLQEMLVNLNSDLQSVETFEERVKIYDLIRLTNVAIHKSKELMLKYGDRLLLNPAARIRAVPKTPPKEEKPSGMAAYMAKRAES